MNDGVPELDQIENALSCGPFKVSRDVELPDGKPADITASRTYFSWKGFVLLSQHIVVRHINHAVPEDLSVLFDAGFSYGKKVNKIPLLRGLQFGYMIIPVIVGESPDESLIEVVSESPPKHWALFEYPVVVNLSTNDVSFFRGSAIWGKFFFSDLRIVVEKYIESSPVR